LCRGSPLSTEKIGAVNHTFFSPGKTGPGWFGMAFQTACSYVSYENLKIFFQLSELTTIRREIS